MVWERDKSVVDKLPEDGPIKTEMKKPQIKHIKYANYGVRKLWKRLHEKSCRTVKN